MDPAADFLRSQQDDINSIDIGAYGGASNNFIQNFENKDPCLATEEISEKSESEKTVTNHEPVKIMKIECEKVLMWREEFESRISKIQSIEFEKENGWKSSAQADLAQFYSNRKSKISEKYDENREIEKQIRAEQDNWDPKEGKNDDQKWRMVNLLVKNHPNHRAKQ